MNEEAKDRLFDATEADEGRPLDVGWQKQASNQAVRLGANLQFAMDRTTTGRKSQSGGVKPKGRNRIEFTIFYQGKRFRPTLAKDKAIVEGLVKVLGRYFRFRFRHSRFTSVGCTMSTLVGACMSCDRTVRTVVV